MEVYLFSIRGECFIIFVTVTMLLSVVVLMVAPPVLQLRGLALLSLHPLLLPAQPAVCRRDRPDGVLNFSHFSLGHVAVFGATGHGAGF